MYRTIVERALSSTPWHPSPAYLMLILLVLHSPLCDKLVRIGVVVPQTGLIAVCRKRATTKRKLRVRCTLSISYIIYRYRYLIVLFFIGIVSDSIRLNDINTSTSDCVYWSGETVRRLHSLCWVLLNTAQQPSFISFFRYFIIPVMSLVRHFIGSAVTVHL